MNPEAKFREGKWTVIINLEITMVVLNTSSIELHITTYSHTTLRSLVNTHSQSAAMSIYRQSIVHQGYQGYLQLLELQNCIQDLRRRWSPVDRWGPPSAWFCHEGYTGMFHHFPSSLGLKSAHHWWLSCPHCLKYTLCLCCVCVFMHGGIKNGY